MRFSLKALLLLIIACQLLFAYPALRRRYDLYQLSQYSDRLFSTLDPAESQKAFALVDSLVPDHGTEYPIFDFNTWYVWRSRTNGDLLLFQGKVARSSFSEGEARIFILTDGGTVAAQSVISMGDNLDILDAAFISNSANSESLRIAVRQNRHGPQVACEVFEYRDRGLHLLRLEDEAGGSIAIERVFP